MWWYKIFFGDRQEEETKEKPKAAATETEKCKPQEKEVKPDSQALPSNSDSTSKKDVAAVAMPVPKITHDWYQTEAQVHDNLRKL